MRFCLAALLLSLPGVVHAQALPGTKLLDKKGDLAKEMVAGIDKYLTRLGTDIAALPHPPGRPSKDSRARLAHLLGVIDTRVANTELELVGTVQRPALLLETKKFKVFKVRWPALPGMDGEGLLLEPAGKPVARVIVLPDADVTPEMLAGLDLRFPDELQTARILAANGYQVVVPVLIDRQDTYSGSARLGRFTNQPHREFVYRMAYEMGRHVIGYEIQKVLAVVDAWQSDKSIPVGVVGFGEGGVVALYAAALDERIKGTLVSGALTGVKRWEQPIYRNLWDGARFADEQLIALIQPRGLVFEHCHWPKVDGPPAPRQGKTGAAPGRLVTPAFDDFLHLAMRVRDLSKDDLVNRLTDRPGNETALARFVSCLGIRELKYGDEGPAKDIALEPTAPRQKRQVEQAVDFTQKLLPAAAQRRQEFFWNKLDYSTPDKFKASAKPLRDHFHDEIIGKLPAPTMPLNARTRLIYDEPKFKGYEVVLDLYEDVFCYGILLVPNDIKPGERRPVVVCQHGLEGRPTDVCNPKEKTKYYQSFGAQLVNRGYIVFAPQAPYIGENNFRELLRRAHPLKVSLYAFIYRQHERILDWLETLPFVDPQRIALYGLSYGGKVAMRIGALLERYCAVICSGDFNEWIWKNITLDWAGSYMFTREYDMYEFNLGNTFNYAEMAALISPRPFMVERGHDDGVGLDEYVAYEYAKVRRHYARLKLPERTEIEFFSGGHVIHGQGTFAFLDRHLAWTPRK